jgi:hypothetical protein
VKMEFDRLLSEVPLSIGVRRRRQSAVGAHPRRPEA